MIRKQDPQPAPSRISHYKIILSGHIAEAFQYAHPIGYNLQSDRKNKTYRCRRPPEQQEITKSSLSRTKNRLLRLINANASMWHINGKEIDPVFVTFTFADNVADLDIANHSFTNYIKRLNYQVFSKLDTTAKYVAVPEFQKRGAVHYHAIFFNLPPISFKEEFKHGRHRKIWGQGFIKVKPAHDIRNTGLYMTKYLTKDLEDRRLVGRKKFFASRGLLKPEIITQEYVAGKIMDYLATLPATYAYITPEKDENSLPIDNPTWHATYSLLSEHRSVIKEIRNNDL